MRIGAWLCVCREPRESLDRRACLVTSNSIAHANALSSVLSRVLSNALSSALVMRFAIGCEVA
eukprot:1025106-Amorphochlora_amoeboformis.AAC.1